MVVQVRKVNPAYLVAPHLDCLDFLELRVHLESREIVDKMDERDWMAGREN
jgi:hypothetical protein